MNSQIEENESSLSAQAWKQFLNKLEEAGSNILNEFGAVDARERAEGFRYLTRLISIGLDLHLEHADTAHPTFTRMITDTRKFIGDNPDAEYDYASLSSDCEYRIWGHRGVSDYLAFCIYGKNEMGAATVGANISDVDMVFDDDGRFELFLSAENKEKQKNWLCLDNNTTSMIVRQYFTGDRSGRGTYKIEALTPSQAPANYNEQKLLQQLDRVGEFVKETSAMSAAVSIYAGLNSVSSDHLAEGEAHKAMEVTDGKLAKDDRPSAQELAAKIDPKVIAAHMPTPDIQYNGAWWVIKPGQAVVIEGKPLTARYWSIQLFNRWLESPDYRFHKVDINSSEVKYEDDGSFKVILAPEDRGFKNWISSNGFKEGQVCFRALKAETAPMVTYRIEKIENLKSK